MPTHPHAFAFLTEVWQPRCGCDLMTRPCAALGSRETRPQCVRGGCSDGAFGEHCRSNLSRKSTDRRMWYEFAFCPVTHAARSTTRAFATASGTTSLCELERHHCANLSVAGFAVHSDMWAAWFCLQSPCWLAQSCRYAGQVCPALLAQGAITATTAHTLRSAQLRLPNCGV